MPPFIAYLLKLSLSLGLVYLFYHLVLRRLTFYTWNRWYLLGYSALAFFLPLIDITPALKQSRWADAPVLREVPVLYFPAAQSEFPQPAAAAAPVDYWFWVQVLLVAGCVVALVRLAFALASFVRLRTRARLLSGEGIRIYHVDGPVSPFSFGRSIYLNEEQHSPEELEQIIRHEFVHVRQQHTLDIIWTELLLVVNWYNPFAWLLRAAVRQNLEFIADHLVLRHGVDRKEYQYLLLKVMGAAGFRIAPQFNFSSLKKRIAMMNKNGSARTHLLKFLFLLPVTALAILSFRQERAQNGPQPGGESAQDYSIRIAAIVFDEQTGRPVPGVQVANALGGGSARTNDAGYVYLSLPVDQPTEAQAVELKLKKTGYVEKGDVPVLSGEAVPKDGIRLVMLIGMQPGEEGCTQCVSVSSVTRSEWQSVGYAEARAAFDQFRSSGALNHVLQTNRLRPGQDTTDPEAAMKAFRKRNPEVEGVSWHKNDQIRIHLKGGRIEAYNLDDKGRAEAEKKYGRLPVAPPPPPPVPDAPAVMDPHEKAPPPPPAEKSEKVPAPPPPPARGKNLTLVNFPQNRLRYEAAGSYITLSGPAVFTVGGDNPGRMEVQNISLQSVSGLVVLDGRWLEPGTDYPTPAGRQYRIVELNGAEGLKKYGNRGRRGAVEFRSQPSKYIPSWLGRRGDGC